MEINTNWENIDWLSNARDLISWAKGIPATNSILLMVRHSHRVSLNTYDEMVNAGLTDLGKTTSYQFGWHLPHDRTTKLFFSFVSRAYETAENIRKALEESDSRIEEFEPLPTIVGPEDAKQEVWDNLHPDGENVTQFVNRWADEEFAGQIEPFKRYTSRLYEDTIERLKQDSDSVLHIHVTHDLCLMSAKRFFLNRPLEKTDREPYLGGIGFLVQDDELRMYNQGALDVVSIQRQ